MNKRLPLILISLFIFSCTSNEEIQKTVYPDLFDGKYDSEFPYRSSSEQLEEISKTIRLVNSIAFYRTFYFDQSDRMTMSGIRRGEQKKYFTKSSTFEETSSGTGTIAYYQNRTLGILTCSHIINYPDSIAVYYYDEEDRNTGLLKSISLIVKRNIYVVPLETEAEFEIVVDDKELDLALLKAELKETPKLGIRTFDFPLGSAKELEWGSFVYVFGFPINYKMISKAIVSSPNLDNQGSFLIDAIFNQGFSGGVVIAIRDGVPNFELVGMVKSVPAEYEYVLRPNKEDDVVIGQEYEKPPVVDTRTNIKYGVTRILSIEAISKFLEGNSTILRSEGLNTENFFK